MRRRSLRILAASAVTALAVPIGVVATAAPAAAVSTCSASQNPVSSGAQSNLHVACSTDNADIGANPIIHDSVNARWHNGAIIEYTACSWTVGNTQVTCSTGSANPAFSNALLNHSVGDNTFKSIGGRRFISSVTNGTTLQLNAPPLTSKAGTGKLWVENSIGRTDENVVTTNASTTITSTTAKFAAADVGGSISHHCLPAGATIASVTNATTAVVSNAAVCTDSNLADTDFGGTSTNVASINGDDVVSSARIVNDGKTTSGSTTFTSASANFQASDVGLYIKAAGLLANTYIASVTNATTVTLNQAATKNSTNLFTKTAEGNVPTQIGKPSNTAPKDGDKVSNLATLIALDPGFVAGSQPCTDGASGFTLAGTWYNPGKFKKITFLGASVPDITGAIGQIVYGSSATTFAAYVVPTGSSTEIVFPSVPTGLANCSGGAIAATYNFDASSVSQGALVSGAGRPGTAAVRGLKGIFPAGAGNYTANISYNNDEIATETQILTINATSGTYRLTFNGQESTGNALKYNANKALVGAALMGIPGIGNSGISITGSGTGGNFSPFTIKFNGGLNNTAPYGDNGTNVPEIQITSSTLVGQSTTGGTHNIFAPEGSVVAHAFSGGGLNCTVSRPASLTFPCGIG